MVALSHFAIICCTISLENKKYRYIIKLLYSNKNQYQTRFVFELLFHKILSKKNSKLENM